MATFYYTPGQDHYYFDPRPYGFTGTGDYKQWINIYWKTLNHPYLQFTESVQICSFILYLKREADTSYHEISRVKLKPTFIHTGTYLGHTDVDSITNTECPLGPQDYGLDEGPISLKIRIYTDSHDFSGYYFEMYGSASLYIYCPFTVYKEGSLTYPYQEAGNTINVTGVSLKYKLVDELKNTYFTGGPFNASITRSTLAMGKTSYNLWDEFGQTISVTCYPRKLILNSSSKNISSTHIVDERGESATSIKNAAKIGAKFYSAISLVGHGPFDGGGTYETVTYLQMSAPSANYGWKQLYDANGITNIEHRYVYQGWTFKATAQIKVGVYQPTSITLGTTTFSNTYFYDQSNTFGGLTVASLTVHFNDGSSYTVNSPTVTLYKDAACTQLLSIGDSLPSSQENIYVKFVWTCCDEDDDSNWVDFDLVKAVAIPYQVNTLTSITLTSAVTFILGNKLNEQKSLFAGKIQLAYANGGTQTLSDMSQISFDYDGYVLDTSLGVLKVSYGNDSNISLVDSDSKITYIAPSNPTITFDVSPVTSYRDVVDKIDLTNVVARLTYSNATYVDTFEYDDEEFGVELYDEDDSLILEKEDMNGETLLSLNLTDVGNYYFEFEFSGALEDVPLDVPVVIFPNFSISGIKIEQTYEDYRVGDKFLEREESLPEEERTKIRIYFYNSGNNLVSKVIDLKDNLSGLAITPAYGTLFKNSNTNQVVRVSSVLDPSVYAEYHMMVSPKSISLSSKEKLLVAIWEQGFFHDGEFITSDKGVLALIPERINGQDTTTITNGIRTLNGGYNLSEIAVGYITDILNENKNARMIMFEDYVPPIDGSSNITVEYPSYNEGSADQINKCHFGILFGTNNATNRLFLSGNPDTPNADWHSAELNTTNLEGNVLKTNGDFSYFTDTSIMFYGETDNKIVGYDIVSNDKLFVIKDKSDKEKTVYFRTPVSVKAIDAGGSEMTDIKGNVLYDEEFALVKGNNSVAGISPKSIINFNGDTLFIDSDNHLLGLDIQGIIGDSQRYANSRSKFIDEKLKLLDLSPDNVFLWTNGKYLFMSIRNYGLFVTHFETVNNGQYEWWYLTSENPVAFLEIDGEIYFFNDEDKVFKFTKSYVDTYKGFIEPGDYLIEIDNNEHLITYNNAVDLKEDVNYKMIVTPNADYKQNLYYQVATIGGLSDYDLQIASNTKLVANNNMSFGSNVTFYLSAIEGDVNLDQTSNVFSFGEKYRLQEIEDSDAIAYNLVRIRDNQVMDLSTLNKAGLCCSVADVEADIVNIDSVNYTFQLSYEGKLLQLVTYGLQFGYIDIEAEICERRNVEAYYITAPFSMGGITYFKTIWSFTVTNDSNVPSELDIAYASNKIPTVDMKTLVALSKADLGTDFGKLDYKMVDFDKTVVPRTYTQYRTLGMQKFMCFAFKNYNDTNAVLSSMSVVYTIPFPAYGSD